MCGVFGIHQQTKKTVAEISPLISQLLQISDTRGKDASGVTLGLESMIVTQTAPISGKNQSGSIEFEKFLSKYKNRAITNALGHTRLATHGSPFIPNNNQPLANKHFVMTHNGIVTNSQQLWKKYGTRKKQPELDSHTLLQAIESSFAKESYLPSAVSRVLTQLQGTATIGLVNVYDNTTFIATNFGSLYYAYISETGTYIFASELHFLESLISKQINRRAKIFHVIPNHGVLFAQNSPHEFSFNQTIRHRNPKPPKIRKKLVFFNKTAYKHIPTHKKMLSSVQNSLKSLQRHTFDYERIARIRRCTRCILPTTTPFISFDDQGVCNYCLTHKPITHTGEKALLKLVEKYRKTNGEPDCIIAFSGGRDSAYGLHYLKTKLKLNPIAFTYDWGMITDLGRRNQARMLGALGVEHNVVAADIATKRFHIRQNILAWIKKPDLGVVPLFMEGDKQCEFYAQQLMKRMGINLMFFCRGNEFEVEEFKSGHCGVKDADPGGVIHNLALVGKLRLAWYYAKQFLSNPAYLNSSIFDTLFGFYSTFIMRYNFVYLWHYIPWSEKEITNTLIKKYNWETATDTATTWRIGDGSPAFYNYIYYQAQGFTENDSFRARQVREGVISRAKALRLVREENKPRYESLKWYFDALGLDGHEVLTAVDAMPKLY